MDAPSENPLPMNEAASKPASKTARALARYGWLLGAAGGAVVALVAGQVYALGGGT